MPNGRISPQITDISSARELLCYATTGQLALLKKHVPGISQGRIALAAGFGTSTTSAGPALTTALKNGPTAKQLEQLDEIIGALAPDVDRTGGLCSLALRLFADHRGLGTRSLTAHIPPSWTAKILKDPPASDVEVLIQASALLAAFVAADKMDSTGQSLGRIRDRYRDDLDHLVNRLILISVAPPTMMNHDAQILLGSLASYAFDRMRGILDYQLRYSPLGFRVWRAITKLVKLNARSEHADALKSWVRGLIRDSEELRKRSIYAGRSLDLELAISVPMAWSPTTDDWIQDALLLRARNSEATIRERGTAAMGLWERAVAGSPSDRTRTETQLRLVMEEFGDPNERPDANAGLRWIAETLGHVIDTGEPVCNAWPTVDELWFEHVQEAASQLDAADIPDQLRAGTKSLFLHMIIQNAGVYRRQAIEAVIAGGWVDPVADALGYLLERERDAWIRIRAEFALGFLARRDRFVEEHLVRACLDAHKVLQRDGTGAFAAPPRAHVTELHTALFAVGDCFGVAGAEAAANRARGRLAGVLTELANMEGDQANMLRRPARAAAYLLMATAQPRENREQDLSQMLLDKLSRHPDEVTADLSKWALNFRFGPNGEIRPLLDAK